MFNQATQVGMCPAKTPQIPKATNIEHSRISFIALQGDL
jgi:hypothetical protein